MVVVAAVVVMVVVVVVVVTVGGGGGGGGSLVVRAAHAVPARAPSFLDPLVLQGFLGGHAKVRIPPDNRREDQNQHRVPHSNRLIVFAVNC